MPQHPTRALALTLSIALATGAATLTPASATPAEHPATSPAAPSAEPASPAAQPDSPHHQATLSALQALVDKGTLPGASAEVRHRDARWTAQVGQADTATGREGTPYVHLRGACFSKTFFSTVMLQVEAEV
ncbi:peptidase, partial [Streptomyces albidoflavus]